MADSPEVLMDEDGKWVRRDAYIAECVEDFDEPADRLNDILDEMLDDGPMHAKTVGDAEYIQLTGRMDAAKALAKYRTQNAWDSATRFLRGDDDGE